MRRLRRAAVGAPVMSRDCVNVDQARRLYDRLRTWPAVARVMRRGDGSRYQPPSITRAVRSADRSQPVTRPQGNTP
jgi:hypothetical protein